MKTGLLLLIGGVVAASFTRLASACPSAHQLAVKGLAKGLNIKEKAKAHFCKLRAEAEEICRQAQDCAAKSRKCSPQSQTEEQDSGPTRSE